MAGVDRRRVTPLRLYLPIPPPPPGASTAPMAAEVASDDGGELELTTSACLDEMLERMDSSCIPQLEEAVPDGSVPAQPPSALEQEPPAVAPSAPAPAAPTAVRRPAVALTDAKLRRAREESARYLWAVARRSDPVALESWNRTVEREIAAGANEQRRLDRALYDPSFSSDPNVALKLRCAINGKMKASTHGVSVFAEVQRVAAVAMRTHLQGMGLDPFQKPDVAEATMREKWFRRGGSHGWIGEYFLMEGGSLAKHNQRDGDWMIFTIRSGQTLLEVPKRGASGGGGDGASGGGDGDKMARTGSSKRRKIIERQATPLHKVCNDPQVTEKKLESVGTAAAGQWGAPNPWGGTPLHRLCCNRAVTEQLIQVAVRCAPAAVWVQGNDIGVTPLHVLCSSHQLSEGMLRAVASHLPAGAWTKKNCGHVPATPLLNLHRNKNRVHSHERLIEVARELVPPEAWNE
jgi:hypothetical protein